MWWFRWIRQVFQDVRDFEDRLRETEAVFGSVDVGENRLARLRRKALALSRVTPQSPEDALWTVLKEERDAE